MSEYNEKQSTVIALWALSMERRQNGRLAHTENGAPDFIVDLVNSLGPAHSREGVFFHKQGYERLFMGREDRDATDLQKAIYEKLRAENLSGRVERLNSRN